MTLHVEFEQFASEAKRHVKDTIAYLSRWENRTRVSAAEHSTGIVVSASATLGLEEARKLLLEQGMEVAHGSWTEGMSAHSDALGDLPFVVAIAYKSGEDMPGLWVDAFPDQPTHAIALKAIYDEFRQSGEIGEMTLEEFVRLAVPNVLIAGPMELERYLNEKCGCD